jgi:hypothetical protein
MPGKENAMVAISAFRTGLVAIALAATLPLGPPARATSPAAEPIAVAVFELDYADSSGEARDQQKEHAVRLQRFAEGLRQDLLGSGKYRIVYPTCDPAPCTAAGSDPTTLVDSARQAGAQLVIFGGVHKMSTLVQWAKLQALDLQSDKIVFDKLITFRGDNDESWRQAESFVAREFIATP